jgi:asparagine synthase (glutamine-hydrolysing)
MARSVSRIAGWPSSIWPVDTQPMVSADTGCVLTFNGEIYNYRELAATLAADGTRFVEQSDTEVLLRAYEAWGDGCVEHLRGCSRSPCGSSRAPALCGARSDRHQAAVLQVAWRSADVRVGAEAILRCRSDCSTRHRRAQFSIGTCGCNTFRPRTTMVDGVRQLRPARPSRSRWTATNRPSSDTGMRARSRSGQDNIVRASRAAERRRQEPHGCRRASGRPSVRRTRFEPRRGTMVRASATPVHTSRSVRR